MLIFSWWCLLFLHFPSEEWNTTTSLYMIFDQLQYVGKLKMLQCSKSCKMFLKITSVIQKTYSRMYSTSCFNTHHDVSWRIISLERNITFAANEKFCLKNYFFRKMFFSRDNLQFIVKGGRDGWIRGIILYYPPKNKNRTLPFCFIQKIVFLCLQISWITSTDGEIKWMQWNSFTFLIFLVYLKKLLFISRKLPSSYHTEYISFLNNHRYTAKYNFQLSDFVI